jgi:hypothetical protein
MFISSAAIEFNALLKVSLYHHHLRTSQKMAHKRRRQYFDFLALPAELRLKVYECLPRQIHHNLVHTQLNKHDDDQSSRGVILITRSLPVVMLRLNKQIHREAKETVRRLAERFILDAVPRVIAMGIESSYHELRAIMRQIPCEHLLLSVSVGLAMLCVQYLEA